ncbi:MAG: hypothetical protein AAFO77_10050, partial [Pseudomonadota bacterium]
YCSFSRNKPLTCRDGLRLHFFKQGGDCSNLVSGKRKFFLKFQQMSRARKAVQFRRKGKSPAAATANFGYILSG